MNNIERFLRGQVSENTKMSYAVDLRQFFSFIGKDETEIEYGDIFDWKSSMLNEYSSATIARKITCIKGYFQFLCEIQKIQNNPALAIKVPTIINKEKDNVSMEEAVKLIDAATNLRDKAIISIYLNTGMRVNELINLTITQYYNDKIVFKMKGDRERVIFLSDSCREQVNKYIEVRKNSGIDNLFVSNHGTPMRADCIAKMLRKVAKKAGLSEYLTNHSLRHTYVTKICNEYGINIAKDVIGHSDISTTQRYAHNTQETIKNVMLGVMG